jgi:predicted dehydrogenase
MRRTPLTRRSFLRRSASALTGAIAAPLVVPSSILGTEERAAPSERIAVGWIGTGHRGSAVIEEFLGQREVQVVAACDVKRDALEAARKRVETRSGARSCTAYRDFRELVARTDIDLVLVTSTDHWHVLHSLAAVRSGKDVYMEKPMGLCLAECFALRQAVKKHRRVFQFGTQQRSDARFRLACELVRNGKIGALRSINVWSPGSASGGPTNVVPVPETLDYDLWLGQAPFKPYTQDRCSNAWWWFISDYALGFIAGWGIHPIDIAAWGAGDNLRGSITVDGKGDFPAPGLCDTATSWRLQLRCEGGLTIHFAGDPRPEEWTKRYPGTQSHGTAFEGDEGWVHVNRAVVNSHPASLVAAGLPATAGRPPENAGHVRNFLDCVKSRRPAVCDIDEAVRSESLVQISEIAIRLGRAVRWDPKSETFPGDEAANARLRRPMRSPWTLGAEGA